MRNDPADVDKDPALADNDPAVADSDPVDADKHPAVADNDFAVADNDPALVDNDPALVDKDPALADKDSADADKDPALADNEPADARNVPAVADLRLPSRAMTTPLPISQASLQRVQAVFTDVDGTLTTDDRIESATLAALENLRASGVKVVLVSGRPAGWGECWMRQWPVDGVIVENGGLHFARGADGSFRKVYAQPDDERLPARARLEREVAEAMAQVPGAKLSTDSVYTEVDLAIDYNEEVKLGAQAATTLESWMRERGVQAVRSSVHVNCWIGAFDKLSAVKRFLEVEWSESMLADDARWVYAGDSFNDAPMFGAFPLSVGVANVRRVLEQIDAPPKFITEAAEGSGFRELAEAVLSARQGTRR